MPTNKPKTIANDTVWVPTEAQSKALEAAQEPGVRRTKAAIIKASGVSAPTFYRWLRTDHDFRRAYEDIWRVTVKSHMPGIVAAQVDKALDGDTRAAELLAKLSGSLKEQLELSGRRGGVVIMLPPEAAPDDDAPEVEPAPRPELTNG